MELADLVPTLIALGNLALRILEYRRKRVTTPPEQS